MDNDKIVAKFIDNQNSVSTKRVYGIHIDAFLAFTGRKPIATITMSDLLEYKKYLADRKPITQRHKLGAVKSFLNFCRRIGEIKDNVGEFVTVPKQQWDEPAVLSQGEAKMLFRLVEIDPNRTPAVKGRDNCILSLMLGCGLRLSEVRNLNIDSVAEQQGVAIIKVLGKGNKPRTIRLPDKITEILKNYIAQFRQGAVATDPLFTAFDAVWKDVKATNRRMSPKGLESAIMYYIDKSGLKEKKGKRVTAHTLRHTCFTLELMHGANIKEIQEQAGHASLTTTQNYLHIIDKLENAGTKFNPLFQPDGKTITRHGTLENIKKPDLPKSPFVIGQTPEPTGAIPSARGQI